MPVPHIVHDLLKVELTSEFLLLGWWPAETLQQFGA